jgi:hypothetical protein
MKMVWLSWYISGVLALLTVAFSLISYAPGAEAFGWAMQAVCGGGALVGIGLALWLGRQPAGHWVQRSKPFRAGFVVVAVAVTALAILLIV